MEKDDEDEGPAQRVTDRVLARIHVSARVPVEGRMWTRVIIGGVRETFLFRAALHSVETKSTLQNPNPPTPPAHKG